MIHKKTVLTLAAAAAATAVAAATAADCFSLLQFSSSYRTYYYFYVLPVLYNACAAASVDYTGSGTVYRLSIACQVEGILTLLPGVMHAKRKYI